MAAVRDSSGSTVPQLMRAVKQLNSSDLQEFQHRFAEWRQQNGTQTEEETALMQACKARLARCRRRSLRELIAKSERGELRPKELQEYRGLARRAEILEATRLAALTQLARLWGQPVGVVMEAIGWEGADEAESHSARPAKTGARSRR